MKYDKAHFIAKFEAIPEDAWTTKVYLNEAGQRCAYGHCRAVNDDDGGFSRDGTSSTEESRALCDLVCSQGKDACDLVDINDGECPQFQQPTPKQRVLAWLHSLPDAPTP